MAMDEMFAQKINQKYWVNLIDLKTKRRESKKYISFLEGALQILNELNDNPIAVLEQKVNPSGQSIYQEAYNTAH